MDAVALTQTLFGVHQCPPPHVPFLFRDTQGFSDHGLRLRQPGEALCSFLVFHGLAVSEEGQPCIVYVVLQFGFIRCPLMF